MKNLLIGVWILVISLTTAYGQFAEPAVTGANFVPNETAVGQSAVLTISFANSGSSPIPASSIELTISTAENYYSSDGLTVPGGTGGALFSWVHIGADVWRGTNTNAIPAFGGGNVSLNVQGTAISPAFETTNINVQPVANFAAFSDAPNNNNLQPKLKVKAGTVGVALLPKAYLQGALFGVLLPDSLMRDDLRTGGYLPSTSPYPGMGMTGVTSANISSLAVLGTSSPAGRDAIVDWVFVELRSAADSVTVMDSRSALIQRDGDIVDVDGISPLTFGTAIPASYFVVVRHRNHLGVMSKEPIALSTANTVIDFRKPATLTFNLDANNLINQARVAVEQGVALWAGNALHTNASDGKQEVIYQGTDNDVNVIYQQVVNSPANMFNSLSFKLKGYYAGDVNLNGETILQGTGNDVEFIYINVLNNHSGNSSELPFFKIKEQVH